MYQLIYLYLKRQSNDCKERYIMYRYNVERIVICKTFFLIIYIICKVENVVSSDAETNLINHLLHDYQKFSRPVANPNLPLSLNITLTLMQIIDLDERNQLLKTNLWLEYYWFDDKLKWNPVSNQLNLLFT